MEHDKERHEVSGNKHERQLSHRSGCYFSSNAPGEGGAERAGADGDDEIQYPEQIPDYEWLAGGKAGPADEGEYDPWCGNPDRYIAEPCGPCEEARQHTMRVECQKPEPGKSPSLDSRREAKVNGKDEFAKGM